MTKPRRALHEALLLALVVSSASVARAGGFETPDNGTEALGRGGAFTAKASDGTAITYNVAGLAEQRGTRILFDGKVSIDNYSFARAGVYPDARDAQTPWGNSFFPSVSNQGGPFFAPLAVVTTDFGYFDRLTVAVGAFGPSGVGNPTFPLGVNGAPSPTRYDVVQATSTIVLPTIAAGYRVTDWLDVGAAFHYVYGKFDLVNVSYADLSPSLCPNAEYTFCDTTNHLTMSGSTVSGSLGALAHASEWLDVGLNVRAPINLTAHGTVASTAPAVAPIQASTGPVAFSTSLPAQVRLGLRAKVMDGNFEQGDVELDGVYEPWSSTGPGPTVSIPELVNAQGQPSSFAPISTTVLHNFLDVYSLRLGGALNLRTSADTVLTLRAGAYYESPSTASSDTRVDFNTLEKIAGTLGVGFQFHGVTFNVAYAGVFSPERVVTDGEIRPINPVQHGQPIDANGKLLPAVNNGTYDGFIDMFAFGVRVELETFFGTKRSKQWTPQGEMPFARSSPPAVVAAPESPPTATAPAVTAEPKAKAKPSAVPAPRRAVAPVPAPSPAAEPAPAPSKKPAKPENNEQKERRLEDPFAT